MRCRKKSTGIHYAIKIMDKSSLIDSASWDMSNVDAEVRLLSALRHPLIIGMDYSFQTDRHALIAMQLAPGGTLRTVCGTFGRSIMPEEYIRFYVAEIIIALHYLHCLGMIYRDMKPANVLVDLSGHIKLADLGGVLDYTDGTNFKQISTKTQNSDMSFPFSRAYALGDSEIDCFTHLSRPVRRRAVFGTPG